VTANVASKHPSQSVGVRALTLVHAVWAGFYAMFPVFKASVSRVTHARNLMLRQIAHYTPGPMKTFVAKNVYQYVGGPDPKTIDEQYKVAERMKRAQENFNRKIPYGAASIRTVYDLEKDEELGRQGVTYSM
jgi:hypothetical protein